MIKCQPTKVTFKGDDGTEVTDVIDYTLMNALLIGQQLFAGRGYTVTHANTDKVIFRCVQFDIPNTTTE